MVRSMGGLSVDTRGRRRESPLIEEWFDTLGSKVPSALRDVLHGLHERIG